MAIAALDTAAPVTPSPMTTSKKRGSLGGVVLWIVLTLLILAPVGSFLILGVSPRVFQQGSQWFTLSYVRQAFSSYFGRGIFNSLWVSTSVAILSVCVATALAWLIHRTNVGGRKFWAVMMWLLLMMPTWMMTLGWGDLLQPFGAAQALGINTHWIYGEFFGPLGIVVVLTSAALPFAYFIISAGLQGLGPEFEDAARIHGAGPIRSLQTVLPIIAPALLSALAICFAETMSDFGVAFTLGYHSNFPMATYVLFNAISNFPANFSVAAVIAAVLIISTIPPIVLQSHVMRKRSYAVLSGRTRAPRRRQLARGPRALATAAVAGVFFIALGVPILGAVIGSLVKNLGIDSPNGVHFTLTYYAQIFKPSIQGNSLGAPLLLSNQLGLVVATGTGVLAVILARRLIANPGSWSQRITDVFLLGSVAVPGVVLGVGYIFFYNLSFISNNVVSIYKTLPLLMLALVANAVPGQTRFMAGPVSQIQPSLGEAARVHGAGRMRAWRTTNLPLMSRVLLWGWLLTFTKTIAELAISQILYPPSQEPASVSIQSYLANFAPNTGTAMTVVTLMEMLAVIGIALTVYRLVTPAGWRRVGFSGVQS
ncbi:MAG TPA: iron ABC transporter permease [Acidimicrobiales bacterium]|jgi:iron(III) transport system permease protein|nr:iron ABC transporter permease [Acidimicrobiales bacterium]